MVKALDVVRLQPWLRYYNVYNISDRLLEATSGDLFVCYNTIRDTYEVHSTRSFQVYASSVEFVIDKSLLNGWLVTDYKARNLKKFMTEEVSRREYTSYLYDKQDERNFNMLGQTLKKIEKTLGRAI